MSNLLSKADFPALTTDDLCVFLSNNDIEFEISGKKVTFIGVAQIDRAKEYHLAWSKKFDESVLSTSSRVIILPFLSNGEKLDDANKTYFQVADPRGTFRLILLGLFGKQCEIAKGLNDPNIFKLKSDLGWIGANTAIAEDVVLGKNVIIHPGVTIYPGVEIGDNVEICPNCVIGGPGFGHVKMPDGKMYPFPHIGGVVIGDNVSIGSNTCIDSGGLSPTTIGAGTKVGNITQIAHNVEISEDCLIGTRVQIAGGTKIGADTEVWSGSTISNNRRIGRKCNIKVGSVVINHLPDGAEVSGNFAIPHKKSLKEFTRLRYPY